MKSLRPHSRNKTNFCGYWINLCNAWTYIISEYMFLTDGSDTVISEQSHSWQSVFCSFFLKKSPYWVMSYLSHLRRYQQSLNVWGFLLKQIRKLLICWVKVNLLLFFRIILKAKNIPSSVIYRWSELSFPLHRNGQQGSAKILFV